MPFCDLTRCTQQHRAKAFVAFLRKLDASVEPTLDIHAVLDNLSAFDPVPLIKEGAMVEVAHSPLKGVVGRLVQKKEKACLVLSVDLIGQGVSIEIDAADVRAY